jgi:hypothetical protein
VPFQIARLRQNIRPLQLDVLHEAIAPFLGLLALFLLRRALPAARRFRSAAPWLALGCWGLAYPRADLTHLSAGLGLYALLPARALLLLPAFLRRGRRRSPQRRRVLAFAAGGAALLCTLGVGLIGGGELLVWRAGGPVHYWDDKESLRYEAMARRHVAAGQPLLVVDSRNEMLYVKLGALPPEGLYVNTSFLEFLDKESVEERVLAALRRTPGTVVMYREPEQEKALLATRLYRAVTGETELVAVDENVEWRVVPPTSPTPR